MPFTEKREEQCEDVDILYHQKQETNWKKESDIFIIIITFQHSTCINI